MYRIKALSIERSKKMSDKRRDNKGRILKTGESQRKDGRYAYKYIDTFGKPQFVYAWKLVMTDKTPAGKRDDIALRDKIKELEKDLIDGIDTIGKKMTVCQLYEKHISQKRNVKRGTEVGRKQFLDILKSDKLGARAIDTVKLSDGKEWVIRMKDNGYAYKTISNYKRSLKAMFYTAIQDDCVRKNPFDFNISDILEDDTKPKEILTPEQEESLLLFAENDKTYQKICDEIIILLGTGLRISEFCGLTVTDLDFKNRQINVDHQLLRNTEIGYYIEVPKTKSGIRQLPMTEDVYQAFQRVLKNRLKPEPIVIDGYSNFLFLKKDGLPKVAGDFQSTIKGLVKKYKKNYTEDFPHVTPHTFRHSFCTRLANAGMNPKALQYLMGHSNITMTLDYYTHATFSSAKAEMERVAMLHMGTEKPAMEQLSA